MKKMIFLLSLLTVIVISGCASDQGDTGGYGRPSGGYERPSGGQHGGHH